MALGCHFEYEYFLGYEFDVTAISGVVCCFY